MLIQTVRRFAFVLILVGGAGILGAQEKPIHLSVTVEDVDITKITAGVAADNGIFKKNGLEVDINIPTATAETLKRRGVIVPAQYVRDVKSPLQLGGGVPLMSAMVHSADSARDRVILATVDPIVHWHVMGQQEVKGLADLKGKRLGVGTPGQMAEYEFRAIAKHMGWNPVTDYTLVSNASDMVALRTHAIDALIASQLMQAQATAGGFQDVADLRPLRIPIAGSGVNSTRSWVKQNPDATRRFVKSIVEAIALMKKDKEATFRAMAKYYNFTRPQMEVSYEGNKEMPAKPYPAVSGIKLMLELFDSDEMRKHQPQDFYDDSFIRELDTSGFIDRLYR